MEKQKQCVICKQPILEDKEKWVRLTDFDCKVQVGEVYNHLECWQERFQITNSKRKQEMYAQGMKAIQNIKDNLDNTGNGGLVVLQ